VPEQHHRAAIGAAHRVDHAGQIDQQVVVARERTARPAARAVAALVVAGHMPAGGIELRRDVRVAPDVLAEPVHEDDGAARRGHRPVAALQRQPVVRRECRRRHRRAGVVHGGRV